MFLVFCIAWIFVPKTGTVVEETTNPTVQFDEGDVVMPDEQKQNENIPENYVLAAGYNNVYKVMDGETCVGYKELTDSGEFVDFDIDIPSYFEKVSGSDTVYAEMTSDNRVLRYRQFNGKEWDIVDREGNILFEIPDNYTRYDLSREIYSTTNEEGETVYRQLVRFEDGTHAWQTVTP